MDPKKTNAKKNDPCECYGIVGTFARERSATKSFD